MKIRALMFTAALSIPSIAFAESPTPDPSKKAEPTSPASNDQSQAGPKSTDSRTSDTSPKRSAKTAKLSSAELAVVAHLHHVNMMEIDMARLAQKNGTAAVRRYGEMLLRDHRTADKELVSLAKQKGIAKIPMAQRTTEVERQEHKAKMEVMTKLKKLKAADFDREYLRQMVEDHEKELAKTDVALASTTDADLKMMLEARKPALQRHADAARELQKGNAQASVTPGTSSPPTSSGTSKTASGTSSPGPKSAR